MHPSYIFTTDFTVRVGDINYGEHMGNDRFLLLFHDTRLRFLESMGCSEIDIGDKAGLIMSEAHVRYRAEVFLHDRLTAGIRIADLTPAAFRMEYCIERQEKAVATGYTRMMAFDYTRSAPRRLPQDFRQKLEETIR